MTWASGLVATLSDDFDATGSSPLQRAGDPIYVLLETLARNGEAARAVFTDPVVARYLLAERRFDLDGLARLAAAAEAAAAGPDVVPDAPVALLHDAALVASAFVNHMGYAPRAARRSGGGGLGVGSRDPRAASLRGAQGGA